MGDEAVHTLFPINLNKGPPGHRLDMEKRGGDGGGGELGGGRGDVYKLDE